MTKRTLRPALALALALSLAACGGKASFPINVNIAGLAYSGLVLTTNGMDLTVAAGTTSIAFPNSLSYGDVYAVSAKSPPLHQTCSVSAGGDTAGRLAAINVYVTCALNQAQIGGTISGLTSDGLQLTNGSGGGVVAPAAGAVDFGFLSNPVPYGVTYGVTVLAQPANNVCSVANGTAVMGDAAVTNIVVTCVPKP
ncbi:MAG: hypothetical protein QFF03_15460 [Pseudomonadota bacterium]|nr:hypothetical protein [Pseudomonadota bacterium]